MKSPLLCLLILASSAAAAGSLVGCTQTLLRPEPTQSLCSNVDWYEAGRADGRLGYPSSKWQEHKARCSGTDHPAQHDTYRNGRETGLVEFCSPTGGLEAGRSGIPYEKVCPQHTEAAFLANYEIGRRIEQLENANNDLESRISTLAELSSATQGESMRAQVDQLRARRAQNNSEISSLESRATVEN